jgi:hypothetical protein
MTPSLNSQHVLAKAVPDYAEIITKEVILRGA